MTALSTSGRRAAGAPLTAPRRPQIVTSVHAEWTKLRTSPGNVWLALAAVVLTIAVSTLASEVVKCPATCGADTTKLSLTGILLGQAAMAGLAIGMISPEYSTGMIKVTLAAMPRRSVMLTAKAIVVSAVVAAIGIVSVLGSLLAGRLIQPHHGFTAAHGFAALSLAHGPTLRAAAGSVLYLLLVALLSLGLAVALREPAVAATVVLGLMYVLPLLALVSLSRVWQHRIERWTPMEAGLSIQATRNLAKLAIAPWPGLGVLAAWTAAALIIGYLLLRLRDA
ncbi:MAG TPA: ABC transporter permease [Streptosporangiaceae bacterium]|jgi:ABC-2 type transport system permease protein|nr:ABC transporter permease [Streptosporangiaceae bacterium]